jgi:magnesium transporter
VHAARAFQRLPDEQRFNLLQQLDAGKQQELQSLVQYPDNSAGAIMDVRFIGLQEHMTVREALRRIRKFKPRFTRQLFILDEQDKLLGMVELQKLALAEKNLALAELMLPVKTAVIANATLEDVVDQFEQSKVTDMPVIDLSGRLLGVIMYDVLVDESRKETSSDLLTMVGASKDEHALSPVPFVVRKRLPWLLINLVTAFLAASVVGLFESTIAQFTALAVLLPVVAGQSGNTGAQALAVTMRSLALREVGISHWLPVARKEMIGGFINGIAIALVTAAGVLVWSGSQGMALVIAISMIIAMTLAATTGVIIPMTLSRLGQDPAQSSSIILTTVTDVVGFFSFLGIAASLSSLL